MGDEEDRTQSRCSLVLRRREKTEEEEERRLWRSKEKHDHFH